MEPARDATKQTALAATLDEVAKEREEGKEQSQVFFFAYKSSKHLETQDYNEVTFFNSDFQKSVRQEQDPYAKEFLQIIRRYQTSFGVLNKPKNEEAKAIRSEIFGAPFMAFKVEIVPLCTREEFKQCIRDSIVPVGLTHDCIELQVSFLKAKYQSQERGPQFLVRNREIHIHLRLLLEDLIQQYFNALYKPIKEGEASGAGPVDQNRLFPFLKQLENMMHHLVKKAITKQLNELSIYESRLGISEPTEGKC